MRKELIFVYNADAGVFNMAADWLHKIFSPKTYPCSLCALTYGHFGEKKAWRDFLNKLNHKTVFLHKDEFHREYPGQAFELPCVLYKDQNQLSEALSAKNLNKLKNLESFKREVAKL